MNISRKGKVRPVAHFGPVRSGNMMDQIILSEDEILHKKMSGFRVSKESYDAAGARADVGHEQSGFHGRQHMITLTVNLADGSQIVIVQQATGNDGLKAVAAARRFAADVNRVGVLAKPSTPHD